MSQYMREKLISAADSGDLDFRDSVMVRNAADAIAKLMWERDQLGDLLKAAGIDAQEIKAENAALKTERERLSVHVDRLRQAALDAIPRLVGGTIKADLRDAYDATPQESLARRDARIKADALGEFGPTCVDILDRNKAKHLAAEYRKQAEDT